jgi:hypothetical protein
MFGEADWNVYGNLLHSIRTGEPAFQHVSQSAFVLAAD